ncbi:MAG: D-2-hydroxyacid dehydrogenase [Candidatus Rokuibacteriota bacterium]
MSSAVRPVSVLVYDAAAAARYAKLVTPSPRVSLRVCTTRDEALGAIREAEVVYGWKVPSEVWRGARRLRWLQVMGAGADWALVPTLPRRVIITRAPGLFGPWMVEYTLGWCLWVTQRMATFTAAKRERRWLRDVIPERLGGRTMAVIGLGDIGRAIARAARALGMTVVGVSLSGRPVRGVKQVFLPRGLLRALALADVVVVAAPLTRQTRGLLGPKAMAAMRPSAWLMNIARGPVVDEGALLDALRGRRIAGAILDVFATEPLPAHHPLWSLDNVVITPHISGPSTPEQITPVFNRNLARYLAGQPLQHVVERRRGY